MTRISFRLPDVGLTEIRGMAFIENGMIVLNIEKALMGLFDTDKQTIKIERDALIDLRVKRGLFRDRLVLEPKKSDLLDIVPGNHRTAIELRVSRKQRRDAERLVDEFEELHWH